MSINGFTIEWIDAGREPQNPANPAYPTGVDLDMSGGQPWCSTPLPYPAKRCGYFVIKCRICGFHAVATTAGRADDPRSIKVACPLGKKGARIEGATVHIDRATTDADWAALDPNSLESDCKDCGTYIELHWKDGEKPPSPIRCPSCGSTNHGAVGSPAGGMHAALWDPRLP